MREHALHRVPGQRKPGRDRHHRRGAGRPVQPQSVRRDGDRRRGQDREHQRRRHRQPLRGLETAGHQRRAQAGDESRPDQADGGGPSGQQRGARPRQQERGADQLGERSRGRVAEPAGAVGAHEVQGQQPESHQDEGLGGGAETTSGRPPGQGAGDAREDDQGRRTPADPEHRPGHGQEHQGRDQQAAGAQREQDLRDRRGTEAAPPVSRAAGGRGGTALGRGTGHLGGGGDRAGPQRGEERVGPAERGEQLLRRLTAQREGAGPAGDGAGVDRGEAVRAASGIGVAGHVTMRPVRRPPRPARAHSPALSTRTQPGARRTGENRGSEPLYSARFAT